MAHGEVQSDFERTGTRVSLIGMACNAMLTALKLFGALAGNSGAMLSDAVNSASDVVGGIIALVGVRVASRPGDREHPYGHERFECIAAFVLCGIMASAGLGIGRSALLSVFSGEYGASPRPSGAALLAALVSVAVKEAMFRFTMRAGKKIDSAALKAQAWDNRADALASCGAFVGIAGARHGLPILEPLASALICAFILRSAYGVFMEACEKVTDHSCDAALQEKLLERVHGCAGVLGVDMMSTREFANRVYVDLEIRADGSIPLSEAHSIAKRVHDALEDEFSEIKHVMVHVNPE